MNAIERTRREETKSCQIGRGTTVHALRTVNGRFGWPVCGQPRKLTTPHTVRSVADLDSAITCSKCRRALGLA